jgi:hypothetical protein
VLKGKKKSSRKKKRKEKKKASIHAKYVKVADLTTLHLGQID